MNVCVHELPVDTRLPYVSALQLLPRVCPTPCVSQPEVQADLPGLDLESSPSPVAGEELSTDWRRKDLPGACKVQGQQEGPDPGERGFFYLSTAVLHPLLPWNLATPQDNPLPISAPARGLEVDAMDP